MIMAEKAGISPQDFVAQIAASRKPILDGFLISFDHWHSTDARREPRSRRPSTVRCAMA